MNVIEVLNVQIFDLKIQVKAYETLVELLGNANGEMFSHLSFYSTDDSFADAMAKEEAIDNRNQIKELKDKIKNQQKRLDKDK